MADRYMLISVLFALAFTSVNSIETRNGKIHITMGTASGCNNAVNFIRRHLVPTYELYSEYLDVEFVPWGRTVRHPNGTMTCQFGPADCWANRLHRCVLHRLRGNTMATMRYMSCEFGPPFPSFRGEFTCVAEAGLNVNEMAFCVDNPQYDTLDQEAQAKAAEPMRIINWVPFVLFNHLIDASAHTSAHRMFRAMVCTALYNDPTTPIRSC